MFDSKDLCIYWSHLRCWFYHKTFKPGMFRVGGSCNFLSYAPTFFAILLWQLYRLHMSEVFFNSSMTIVSSSYDWSKYSSILHWQLYRLHMSEKFFNSSLTIVSSSIKRKTTNQRYQMIPLHCVVHVSYTWFIKFW